MQIIVRRALRAGESTGERKGRGRAGRVSGYDDATSGRFLPVHPIGGGHVAVAALYSHGWHVAVRFAPSTFSCFFSSTSSFSYTPLAYCSGLDASKRNRQGGLRYLIF